MNGRADVTHTGRGFRARCRAAAPVVAVFVLLAAAALFLQARGGAFDRELAGYPDEAAHYVTALMLHDYVTTGLGQPPMQFALDYYLHYPKVAFGHWPPVFYIVQAAWMLVFTASKTSTLVLMALLAALVGAVLFKRAASRYGAVAGFILAALYIALPVVQENTGMVMSENLLTLFCFLAAISFGAYLDSENWRDCAWFGAFASLAILTKGNAWALALIPPVALAASGKWRILRRRAPWFTAAGVLAICLPWQLLTLRMAAQGWNAKPGIVYTARSAPVFAERYVEIAGAVVFVMALIGITVTLAPRLRRKRVEGEWAAMLGLLLSMLVFHALVPAGVENRKLMPAAPALLLFALEGTVFLARRIRLGALAPATAAAALAVVFGIQAFTIPAKPARGLIAAAESVSSWPVGSVALVASDASGEGAMISEVAMRDRRPGHIILRASKLLGDENWGGDVYQPRYSDVASLQRALDQIPVDLIVIDNGEGMRARQHQKLLMQAVTAHPGEWVRVTLPGPPGAVDVYRRATRRAIPAGAIRLTAESMLYRTLPGINPRTD